MNDFVRENKVIENQGIKKRRDRTARLLKVLITLAQYPDGLTIPEIAHYCYVSTRTIYRDLKTLEQDVGVPLWENGSKRGIDPHHFLPSVHFSPIESLYLFMVIRIIQTNYPVNDPVLISTILKLNAAIPFPFKEYVHKTITLLQAYPIDLKMNSIVKDIMESLLSRKRMAISYQHAGDSQTTNYFIEPYTLEPGMNKFTVQLLANCVQDETIRTFRMNRIQSTKILAETYSLPVNLDIINQFQGACGIMSDSKNSQHVKLKFSARVSPYVRNIIWHHSQVIESQHDGTTVMTLLVEENSDLSKWILSWGYDVKVLSPDSLRENIKTIIRMVMQTYSMEPLE